MPACPCVLLTPPGKRGAGRRTAASPTGSPGYNATRPPGRGSVWQSTWFGIRGSQVQILPPRRGPSSGTGSGPRGGHGIRLFGGIFFSASSRQGPGALIPALTHGQERVYSGAPAGDVLPRRAPFFMLLLLDIPELDVMELARMFAPATSARSTVRVSSKVFDVGFLPLAPETHILAPRMAGAGTHR